MTAFASVLCLSAIAAAGDVEFGGVGQTVYSNIDSVDSLDTRLVLGAYGESDGTVFGFSFETIDNLEDTAIWDAYVGADLGGLSVKVGRFQRSFSAELELSEYGLNGLGLSGSSVFGLVEQRVDGVSVGGDLGDLSFSLDVVGDDVFDDPSLGGRVEFGSLGFGFLGEEMDTWTVDISSGNDFIAYTEDNEDWFVTAQAELFEVASSTGYGRVEYDSDDEVTYALGLASELDEGVQSILEYDDRDEAVRFGIRFSF